MESLNTLLAILGGVCLLLSGFLVVNTISALVAQQVRQIGVMKAVGADLRQVAGLYLGLVIIYGILALVIALPIGAYLAQWLVGYSTTTLNFDAVPFGVSPDALALEVAAGLVLPVLAALPPIVSGSRITVREAIASYGLGGGAFGRGILDRGLQRLRCLSRPMLLSLRNTVRRKTRLALTLGTLILGGAIFIAVLSVQLSLARTIDEIYGFTSFDIEVTFSQPYPLTQVQRLAQALPGVSHLEGWELHTAHRIRPDGTQGGQLQLTAPPPATSLLVPVVLDGRWLATGDQNALVINSDVRRDEPDLRVGSDIKLKIDGVESTWRVVGLARGTLSGPIVYANAPYVARLSGTTGDVSRLQILASQAGATSTQPLARALEERFKAAGVQVSETTVVSERKALLATNFSIIVNFLLSMAVLVAIVGGLGLTATMSISVLERTREIGVMRAIGASDTDVQRIVIGEGLAIGTLSWIGGAIMAVPMGWLLCAFVGAAFLHESIGFIFPAGGALLWLAGALVLSAAASFVPAWNATRLSVRDVLTYE
jgi:putative ABC transport system permease protein